MIYKIVNSPDFLVQGVKKLQDYDIFFLKGCLFVSDKNNIQDFYQIIKQTFEGSDITEITEYNLIYEPAHVIDWVKKEMVASDLIKYERDNQEKLQQIMNQLDYIEKELFEGSDSQCQRKLKRNEEDLQKTKSKSILMKVLNKLGWSNNRNSQ
jgi:hypothetical protein